MIDQELVTKYKEYLTITGDAQAAALLVLSNAIIDRRDTTPPDYKDPPTIAMPFGPINVPTAPEPILPPDEKPPTELP